MGKKKEILQNLENDFLGDILHESIEFDSMYPDIDQIKKPDRAGLVTFEGESHPKDGWVVVITGAPGSGKGLVIKNQVLINAEIVDSLVVYPSLSNQIIDITGKSSTKLMNVARTYKKAGYKTSLIWVITERNVAMLRNLKRNRVVGERLFHEIHNQVNETLMDFLLSDDAKDYDEAWIVFNGSPEVTDLSKVSQQDLFNNSAYKLDKTGLSFKIDNDRIIVLFNSLLKKYTHKIFMI